MDTSPRGLADGPTERSDTEISFVKLLTVLLRSRGLILAVTLLVTGVTVGATFVTARRYTATASFVPQSRRAPSNISALAAQFGMSVPGGDGSQSPAFYMYLLESREILRPVVARRYAFTPGGDSVTLGQVYGIEGPTAEFRLDATIDRLRQNISTKTDTRTGVVSATIVAATPRLAYGLASALVDELNRYNLESRQSQAGAERRFAQQRLNEIRTELRSAEGQLQAFLTANRGGASPQLQFDRSRLEREVQLRQELYNSLAQALEQAKIEEVRDTPVITLVDRPFEPTKPESRHLVTRLLLAIIAGSTMGALLAFARAYFRSADTDASDRAVLAMETRDTLHDLARPWRLFGRAPRRSRS